MAHRLLVLLALVLLGTESLAQVRPTPDELGRLPIQWRSIGLQPDDARGLVLRILDRNPRTRAALLAELRSDPERQTHRVLTAMFNSLVSVMGSDVPRRAEIAAGLSEIYAELAHEVRGLPGIPTPARVAFGRTSARFLEDYGLVGELARFVRTRAISAELARAGGINVVPAAGGAPQKIEWQIPEPIPSSQLVPGPTTALLASMKRSLGAVEGTLFCYEKQANRCRLVAGRGFSAGFVQKQQAALVKARADAAKQAKHEVRSVPRLLEADLYSAFVWPQKPVRKEQLLKNLDRVDLSTGTPLWEVNQKGLELRRRPDGVHLEATFETDIDNAAVLQSVKSSIEQLWTAECRIGDKVTPLRTTVNFRKLGAGEKFSDGSLRLTEGVKNCATSGGIKLCRVYDYTAPAHEFAHVLGVRDGYRTFYDPRARTFVHVQDQRTLLGSLKSPLSQQSIAAALRNLDRRPAPAVPRPGAAHARLTTR